jgi:hypothetical protein
VPIRIDTAGIVVLTVGLIVVVAAAIAAMSAAARRADLGSTLRLGDE